MTKGFLAIDTSNYTTSCAIYRAGGITERKRLLPVPSGHVGLRQSDAVFSHIKALGELMEQLREAARYAIEDCLDEGYADWNEIKNNVKDCMSKFIFNQTKRRPMILPVIMNV